jgi:hypothetical protein
MKDIIQQILTDASVRSSQEAEKIVLAKGQFLSWNLDEK